jgi:hypothetical protein
MHGFEAQQPTNLVPVSQAYLGFCQDWFDVRINWHSSCHIDGHVM